jgi:hypothetical protein
LRVLASVGRMRLLRDGEVVSTRKKEERKTVDRDVLAGDQFPPKVKNGFGFQRAFELMVAVIAVSLHVVLCMYR